WYFTMAHIDVDDGWYRERELMKIRVGAKRSDVSMARADGLVQELREQGHEVEIVLLPNTGDRESIGQLRLGLLRDDFDVAIHRLNRVPTESVAGLTLAAIPQRGDGRDAVCVRDGLTLAELPPGAVVATDGELRHGNIRRLRSDLEFEDLQASLTSYLDRVAAGTLDAVVASAADIEVIGREEEITDRLPFVAAPGLGAVGYECREVDTELVELLSQFDDPDTRICVITERAARAALDVHESVSVGAFAQRSGLLTLKVEIIQHDGSQGLSVQLGMPTSEFHAIRCGHRAAEALRQRGAEQLGRAPEPEPEPENAERPKTTDLRHARVLIPREEGLMSQGLRDAGMTVDAVPLQRRDVLSVSSTLEGADWVAFTSRRAVDSVRQLGWTLPRDVKVAAIGPGTADALVDLGYTVDLQPEDGWGVHALLDIWPEGEGKVFVPGSALLAPTFVAGLQAKGWAAQLIPIYTMKAVSQAPPELVEAWNDSLYDAVVIASGSSALAVSQLLGWNPDVIVIAVGESAAAVLKRVHVEVAGETGSYKPEDVVELLRAAIEDRPATA
ncbi:MAG: uroporphyrinogen-III synthase, partial [Propionibacteriaceae bacterium]|nr:uroporphyrinogen-III synthase [Propionibacteriaceae bacterium]